MISVCAKILHLWKAELTFERDTVHRSRQRDAVTALRSARQILYSSVYATVLELKEVWLEDEAFKHTCKGSSRPHLLNYVSATSWDWQYHAPLPGDARISCSSSLFVGGPLINVEASVDCIDVMAAPRVSS